MGNIKTDIISGEVRLNASPAHKELNQLAKSTSELTKQNERLRQEKTRLELAERRDGQAINKLNNEIKKNNLTIKQNKFRMEELHKVVGLTSLSKTQLTRKSRNLQRQLDATSKAANPAEYKRLAKELRAVDRQLNKVRRGSTATQRLLSSAKGFGAGMLGAFSVTQIVSGAVDTIKDLLSLSVKMEGDGRRANIVFGDSLGYVEKQAAKLSKRMGVTKNEFIAAASATADLLIPLDFTRDQAAKMSVQLQSLTGALDEWTGGQVGASEISAILTKAMLGENEQLKQLGIAIRKDSEEFRTLVKQKLATTNATKAQAEAMATLELIQKKSADAQRAYVTEGNKLLRMQKQIGLWWRNLKEGVVEYFNTPISQKIKDEKTELNKLVDSLVLLNEKNKKRKYYIDKIQNTYPEFFANMDIEKTKNSDIRDRLREVNGEYREKIRLALASEKISKIEKKQMDLGRRAEELFDGASGETKKQMANFYNKDASLDDLENKSVMPSGMVGSEMMQGTMLLRLLFDDDNINNSKLGAFVSLQKELNRLEKQRQEILNKNPKLTEEKNKETLQDYGNPGKKSVAPDTDKTTAQINQWKQKAKELVAQAQLEISAAKVAAMDEGYEKEEAKENQRWKEELARLEARKIKKAEKQKELFPEQLAANAEIDRLIEAQREAHWKRLAELEEKCENDHKLKKTEEDLLRIEEQMLKAEEEEAAFEDKMSLAQQRYDIEFAAAEGNRKKELAAKRKFGAAVDKIQEEQHRKEELRKKATEGLAQGLFNNLKSMAKKGTALSKALYLFEQAMAIRQVIINTQIANAKAVAASPLTGGMPWVGINTALGAVSVGLILAQTASEFKGKEEGGYIDVRREQDGKPFRAKYKPNHRGYTSGPTVITGENGMEFVANAKAAQNPTVRPFLDIIDRAQRQGTIETLNLAAVRAEKYKGFADGGYVSPPSSSAFDEDMPNSEREQEDKFERVMEVVQRLASRPLEFSLLRFNEMKELQKEIDEDINR